MTEEEYKASVEKSQQDAHEETMWGKPARDIVTGIGNNGGIKPVRAIWELVQNARDVVADGNRAKVVFTRNADSVEFQHDGIPFTHKTIEALIMQTSSKQATNAVQVGQYGTGFLTTHLFGLSFKLTASLLTSEAYPRYYKIENFLIDRSPNDKEAMKKNLQDQWSETQDWGKKFEDTTEEPYEHTIFRYASDGEQAKLNAELAFKDAPAMAPYVLTLNTNVESIEFNDEVNGTSMSFVCDLPNAQMMDSLADCDVFKNVVKRTIVTEGKSEVRNFFVYSLVSHEVTEDEHPSSKMTVMMPVKEDADGSMRVVRFEDDLPLVYIYLPLLGTDNWGFNFMLHSSLFTCDKDSRDSLRLVGNGQNNDYQADANRELIALANKMICQFIDKNITSLKDAKYLAKAAFQTEQADKKLGEYYQSLQKFWRDKFESLTLVDCHNGGKGLVSAVKVLDPLLCAACESDSTLLDAVYGLIEKSKAWVVPMKDDMLYWSKTINRWYLYEQANPHSLTINDLAGKVPSQFIQQSDLQWLLRLCKYIVDSKQESLLDTYTMIPNEVLKLQKKTPSLHPAQMDATVRKALSLMDPENVELFVHPDFYDLLSFSEFGYSKIKDSITNYITKHNAEQNGVREQIMAYKLHDLSNPASNRQFNAKNYDSYCLGADMVSAMLNVAFALLPEDSQSKPAQLLSLLVEFYSVTIPENLTCIDKVYDLDYRSFMNSLAYDALFKFTLLDDKSAKSDWCKRVVLLIHSLDNKGAFLGHYQIYQDQLCNFKYADWLKKQSSTVPDRAIEIYDIIIKGVKSDNQSASIKHTLVSKDYAAYYDVANLFDGLNECKEIEGELEKKGFTITDNPHKNLYVEIVQKITSADPDHADWKHLFTEIDAHKGQIMFSVIQSQTKRDSIFTIMKVEDEKKLKAIAELADNPRLYDIIEEGKKAVAQKDYEDRHNTFIHALGDFVERILLEKLQGVVSDDRLKVDVTDKQGGQDYLVKLDDKIVYYVEVKSRWKTSESVEMSSLQFKTSVDEQDHYSLCYVDMTWKNIEDVGKREYDDLDTCISHTRVLNDVGRRNERCIDSVKEAKDRTHIGGGYSLVVPQVLFDNEPSTLMVDGMQFERATDFNGLVDKIKAAIDKEMSQN